MRVKYNRRYVIVHYFYVQCNLSTHTHSGEERQAMNGFIHQCSAPSSNITHHVVLLSVTTQPLPSFRVSNQLCVFNVTEPRSARALTRRSTGHSPFM